MIVLLDHLIRTSRRSAIQRKTSPASVSLALLLIVFCMSEAGAQDFDQLLAEYEAAREAYEQDLAAWQQDVAAHDAEMARFQQSAQEFKNRLAKFNADASQFRSEVAAYEQDLKAHNRGLSQYQSDVQNHNAAVRKWDTEVTAYLTDSRQYGINKGKYKESEKAYIAEVARHNRFVAKVDKAVEVYNTEVRQYEGAVAYYMSLPEDQRTQIQYNRLVHWRQNLEVRRRAVDRVVAEVRDGNGETMGKTDLDQWQADLTKRFNDLSAEYQRLQNAKGDLERRREAIDVRKQQLDSRAAEIDSRAADLIQRKSFLDQAKTSLDSRASELAQQELALVARESKLRGQKETLDQRKVKLDQRLKALHVMLDRLEELLRNSDEPKDKGPLGGLRPAATGTAAITDSPQEIRAAKRRNGDATRANRMSAPTRRSPSLPTAAGVPGSLRKVPLSLPPRPGAAATPQGNTGASRPGIMSSLPTIDLSYQRVVRPGTDATPGQQQTLRPRRRTLSAAAPRGPAQAVGRPLAFSAPAPSGNGTDELNERERRLARLKELNDQIKDLEKKKQQARDKLEAIIRRVPGITKALEDWAELVDDARDDVIVKAVTTALSVFLTDKTIRLRDTALIKRQELNGLEWLRLRPDSDPQLPKKIGDLLREIHLLEGRAQITEFFDNSVAFAEIAKGMKDGNQAEMAMEIAKLFIKDPRAKLLLDEVEFVAAVGYAHVAGRIARTEVERLNELTEDQLREVEIYGANLRKWTDEIKKRKADMRRLLLGG